MAFDAAAHPRQQAGSPAGGQFKAASGGGGQGAPTPLAQRRKDILDFQKRNHLPLTGKFDAATIAQMRKNRMPATAGKGGAAAAKRKKATAAAARRKRASAVAARRRKAAAAKRSKTTFGGKPVITRPRRQPAVHPPQVARKAATPHQAHVVHVAHVAHVAHVKRLREAAARQLATERARFAAAAGAAGKRKHALQIARLRARIRAYSKITGG